MAAAAVRPQTGTSGLIFRWRALLDRVGVPILLTRGAFTPPAAIPQDWSRAPGVSVSLLNAYAVSAVEISRRAAELDRNGGLSIGPVAVQALVSDVTAPLEPRARQAGVALLRDSDSHCDGVCCADPSQLRAVLSHLLLRALCMEQVPGHVRVMVTLTSREAHILVLSRTPEATLAAHADAARDDLIAPQRLLKAMGGSLVLEPRRAGYLPLCIALPAFSAAPAQRAA